MVGHEFPSPTRQAAMSLVLKMVGSGDVQLLSVGINEHAVGCLLHKVVMEPQELTIQKTMILTFHVGAVAFVLVDLLAVVKRLVAADGTEGALEHPGFHQAFEGGSYGGGVAFGHDGLQYFPCKTGT